MTTNLKSKRKRQRRQPLRAATGSAIDRAIVRVKRWNVTGYYSCNKCGWKGDRPHNHNQRCDIEAVFVNPLPQSPNSDYATSRVSKS